MMDIRGRWLAVYLYEMLYCIFEAGQYEFFRGDAPLD